MKTIAIRFPSLALAGAVVFLSSCSEGDVELNLEVPPALTVGTQVDLSHVANLPSRELEEGFRPDPVRVPAGAQLLSRGKPVTSSDTEEPFDGDLWMITDGEKDGNEGYSVIISGGPQWVRIDLEQEALIDAVVVWHYFKTARVVNDVIVQISSDPEFSTGVVTVFNNDVNNTSGQGAGTDSPFVGTHHGRQIAANGTRGRYVRLWSNGNSDNLMNEYIEVEVFGRPVR